MNTLVLVAGIGLVGVVLANHMIPGGLGLAAIGDSPISPNFSIFDLIFLLLGVALIYFGASG